MSKLRCSRMDGTLVNELFKFYYHFSFRVFNETHAKHIIRPNKSKIELRLVFDFYCKKKVYTMAQNQFQKQNNEAPEQTIHRNEHGRVKICRFFFFLLGLKVENNPRNAIVVFYRYSFCLCLCVIFTLNVHLNLENVVNTVTKFTNEVFLLSKWMKAKQFRHCVCVLCANTFALIYCVYPPSYVPTEWTWFVCFCFVPRTIFTLFHTIESALFFSFLFASAKIVPFDSYHFVVRIKFNTEFSKMRINIPNLNEMCFKIKTTVNQYQKKKIRFGKGTKKCQHEINSNRMIAWSRH